MHVYSVLVVSASEAFVATLSEMLPEAQFSPVVKANNISLAKRLFTERSFDFVIINSPLPDDIGIRFAIDTSSSGGTAVLMLVRNEIHDEIYSKVFEHGVFTLAKPISRNDMTNALMWMASSREKFGKFAKKQTSIEDKMQEIRLVNKAKWLLITKQGLEEPDAHRLIEKQAMDRCVAKREIAEEIIRKFS